MCVYSRNLLALVSLLALLPLCLMGAQADQERLLRAGGLHDDVRLLQSDEQGVELILNIETDEALPEADGSYLPRLQRITDSSNPVRTLFVALPPTADPVVHLVQQRSLSLPGPIAYCSFEGENPKPLAEQSVTQIDDLRALRIDLNLLRSSSSRSRIVHEVHLRVDFGLQGASQPGVSSRMPARDRHLQFVNGYQIGAWAQARELRRDTPVAWDGDTWLRIPVSEEGLYQIRPSLLEGLGLDASSMDPAAFKLYSYGGRQIDINPESDRAGEFRPREVPMIRELDTQAGFSGSERLLFYGRGTSGLAGLSDGTLRHYSNDYTDTNCYYLLVGGTQAGRSMEAIGSEVDGETQLVEQAHWRGVIQEHKNLADTGSAYWYGDEFQGSGSYEYRLTCPALDAGELRLEWDFWCESGGSSQRILFELDGVALAPSVRADSSGHNYLEVSRALSAGQHRLRASLYSSNGRRILLQYLILRYDTEPGFVNGELRFESPTSPGDYRFQIRDFPSSAYVLDVTDFDSLCVTQSSSFADRVPPIVAGSILGRARLYYGAAESALRTPQGVSVDHMPDLKAEAGSSKLIVIAPEAYTDVMQELVSFKNTSTQTSARQVSLEDVYREFNCGVVDPGAVRNFLLHEYTQSTPADYVLIVGNGHYDYRGLISGATPMVFPAWYSSVNMVDDFFVRVDASRHLGYTLGRLPANNVADAEAYVQKAIAYESGAYAGDWHNRLLFVADDEHWENGVVRSFEFIHSQDTETLIDTYVPSAFDTRRLYIFEYPSVYNPEIRVYEKPQAEQQLMDELNAGVALVNYMGHGNNTTWAHEYVFHQSKHLPLIQANNRPAMYLAATCSWAEIDLPVGQAMPLQLVNLPGGGAIGILAATRKTTGGGNFNMAVDLYPVLFGYWNEETPGEQLTLADAMQHAKNASPGSSNRALYLYLGDPSIKPAFPLGGGEVERLLSANVETDTLLTTELAVIQAGTAAPADGNLVINGAASVMVREAPVSRVHAYDAIDGQAEYHGVSLEYEKAGPRMYRGSLPVEDASINARFVVPVDYSGIEGNGRIHMYYSGVDAMGDHGEGVIYYDDFAFDYNPDPQEDTTSPTVELWFNSVQWRPEDWIAANSTLVVQISDSSGVNITGEVGHRIELVLDGGQPIDLTDAFEYDTESWTSGQATTQLPQLEAGRHELRVRAFDSFNNPGYAESEFYVASEGAITLGSVVNFPNPVKETTQFTFTVDGVVPDMLDEVILSVYTLRGRRVARERLDVSGSGALYYSEEWRPQNDYGDPLARGVYLYRLELRLEGFSYSLLDDYGNLQDRQVSSQTLSGQGKMIVE